MARLILSMILGLGMGSLLKGTTLDVKVVADLIEDNRSDIESQCQILKTDSHEFKILDMTSFCEEKNNLFIDTEVKKTFDDYIHRLYEGGSSTVGPANPAAVMCYELGGDSVEFVTDAGSSSLCQFGDALIGDWTFYWAINHLYDLKNSSNEPLAVTAFLGKLLPKKDFIGDLNLDREEYLCLSFGAQVETSKINPSRPLKQCKFEDNSRVELTTLFNGPNFAGNKILTYILN